MIYIYKTEWQSRVSTQTGNGYCYYHLSSLLLVIGCKEGFTGQDGS